MKLIADLSKLMPSWNKNEPNKPSDAAQLIHDNMYTILSLAISLFVMMRSSTVATAGTLAGFSFQVYMSNKTELDETQKFFMEITDEPCTTRNDLIRIAVPAIAGTLFPPAQLATDAAVGFCAGGLATRKALVYIAPHSETLKRYFK